MLYLGLKRIIPITIEISEQNNTSEYPENGEVIGITTIIDPIASTNSDLQTHAVDV